MSKLAYQYDILNLTPANAQPVEANFTRIEQHVNQELVERDGSVAMRSPLKLPGDPIADLDAAPKQYVDQVIPVGLVMMWAAAAPPSNGRWLLCDGAPLQTAQYPELFAVIGYSWGGSGGTFNAPNFSGRMPIGTNASHPLAQTGGTENTTLIAHAHTMTHDHGAGSTNIVNTDHLHTVTDHLHGISFMSDLDDTNHVHYPETGGRFVMSGTPDGSGGPAAIMQGGNAYSLGLTAGRSAQHRHAINGITGAADRPLGTSYQDRSPTHSHTAAVPAFSGSTQSAGSGATTGANMPPFLAIPYIIRCR